MAKRILGMDVGHDSLKLALINGHKIEKAVTAHIPLNLIQDSRIVSAETMGEFIKDVCRENGMYCPQVAYVLSNENVYTRTITMPKMTPEQLAINLPYEFSDFISDEPRKYVYDYAMLSNPYADASDTMELMAVAVTKSHLELVREFIKKAGMKLVKAAPTVSSFISLIRGNGSKDTEYCILDLGYKAIRMHIFHGDRYEVTRTLDIGLSSLDSIIAENTNVDVHLAHTYLMKNYEDCQNAPYCTSAYENITMELMRALNFYRFSNPESNLENVWLSGGGIQIRPLWDMIESSLDMSVHHAKELLSRTPLDANGLSSFVQAIGITDLGETNGVSFVADSGFRAQAVRDSYE